LEKSGICCGVSVYKFCLSNKIVFFERIIAGEEEAKAKYRDSSTPLRSARNDDLLVSLELSVGIGFPAQSLQENFF
jgi:hypothetical protein